MNHLERVTRNVSDEMKIPPVILRREPDASVAEMDVRYNDNRVEEDTTLYDVLLFGIAGIIIVLIPEQFVQMGIALQRPLIDGKLGVDMHLKIIWRCVQINKHPVPVE
jgi:hypothetical protein